MEIYLILFISLLALVWFKFNFPEATLSKTINSFYKLSFNATKPHTPASTPACVTIASASETTSQIPEDSVLKRHYLTQLQAELEAKSAAALTSAVPSKTVIPEDSVLRRHFLTEWEANHAKPYTIIAQES